MVCCHYIAITLVSVGSCDMVMNECLLSGEGRVNLIVRVSEVIFFCFSFGVSLHDTTYSK